MQPSEVLASISLANKAPLSTGKLIFCNESDKCKDALAGMSANNLSCLPVFNAAGDAIGLLDMVDITAFVATLHGTTIDWKTSLRDAHEWVKWNQALVKDALTSSRCAVTISDKGSFLDGARALVNSKCHRVLVSNDAKQVVNVLTQSDVVKTLYNNLEKMDTNVLHRPLALFKNIEKTNVTMHVGGTASSGGNVLYVDQDSKAIEAFRLLHRWGFTALPVVDLDKEHKLVGTISARDVRGIIDTDDFPQVLYNSTALEFSDKMHAKTGLPPTGAAASLAHTFKEAIEMLHALKVHRLWVVNDKQQVINVLSLTDVLAEVVASEAA